MLVHVGRTAAVRGTWSTPLELVADAAAWTHALPGKKSDSWRGPGPRSPCRRPDAGPHKEDSYAIRVR
eukprot:15481002-Alexandrium_andersonii.AAC.1